MKPAITRIRQAESAERAARREALVSGYLPSVARIIASDASELVLAGRCSVNRAVSNSINSARDWALKTPHGIDGRAIS